MTETCCGFGESEDDRVRGDRAEDDGHPVGESVGGGPHPGRVGGQVLAEDGGDQQVRAPRVAPQTGLHQVGHPPP